MTKMISVFSAATCVFMLAASPAAMAAGEYDGTWTGGGTTATKQNCAANVTVQLTIVGDRVNGTGKYGNGQGPQLSGAVQPDGSFTTDTGMKGKFTPDGFSGELVNKNNSNCLYPLRLKKS